MKQAYKVDTTALEICRMTKGYKTRKSLAEKAGIHRNTYDLVVSGKLLPSTKVMYGLVEALELTPEEAARIFFANELTQ